MPRPPSIALVTCRVLPEPDPDQELLLGALERRGARARLLAWNDPAGEPGEFDVLVLRSTWDYYRDPAAFQAWIERAGTRTRLLNPPAVLRWNLHKGYLRELAEGGARPCPRSTSRAARRRARRPRSRARAGATS